jgi:hypothetical protein
VQLFCEIFGRDAMLSSEARGFRARRKILKTQIDALVRGIRHDLAHPAPADPVVAAAFYALGLDGLTRARQQRDVLASYDDDGQLSAEARQYAREQLKALPAF